MQLYIVGMVS